MIAAKLKITNKEYRALDAWSKSDLDLIHKSLSLIDWSRKAKREESAALSLGTAFHSLILEPESFKNDYLVAPKFDARTKAGKEALAEFSASAGGKIILSSDDNDKLELMRDSVMCHPSARELLESAGEAEASIISSLLGVKVKCRPDYMLSSENVIVDIKTTDDVDRFTRSVIDYRYHVQAAFYSDIIADYKRAPQEFYFIAVGTKRSLGRYPCRVFKLSEQAIDKGRRAYKYDLDRVDDFELLGAQFHAEIIDF